MNSNEFTLIVDYTKSLEQTISDNHYDFIEGAVNSKNFPILSEKIGKTEEISAKLFHFNRVIESDDVISQIDRAGFRQATLMEFLAFAIAYPDLQRKFSVSAFGSTWSDDSGCLCMPWISTVHDESIISPLKLKGEYSAYWRFLAVSK